MHYLTNVLRKNSPQLLSVKISKGIWFNTKFCVKILVVFYSIEYVAGAYYGAINVTLFHCILIGFMAIKWSFLMQHFMQHFMQQICLTIRIHNLNYLFCIFTLLITLFICQHRRNKINILLTVKKHRVEKKCLKRQNLQVFKNKNNCRKVCQRS